MVAGFAGVFGVLVGGLLTLSTLGLVMMASVGAVVLVAAVPPAAVGLTPQKLVGGWAEDSTLDRPLGRVVLEKLDAFQG